MNILLVSDLYPLFKGHKGIPETIEAFALAWVSLGHNVVVLRCDLIPNTLLRGRCIYKNGVYYHNGIKIYNKNFFLPDFSGLDFLEEENFDIVVSHMPVGTLAAAAIARKFKKLHCATVHSSDIEVLENYRYIIYFRNALKKVLAGADIIGARSIWLSKKIAPYVGQKEVFLAPSGIKTQEIISEKEAKEKFKNTKTLKITCVSKLIKRKNISSLILALNKLKDRNYVLEIYGEGPDERKLKKLAKGNLNIIFCGQKSRDEIQEKLKSSHVFILPSIKETFGLVYLEALSKGCITVCTENCAMAGFIKDGINGFLSKPTADGTAEILNRIFNLTNEEMVDISKKALDSAYGLEYYNCANNYIENMKKRLSLKKFLIYN